MGRWGRGGIAAVVVLGFLAAGIGAGAAVRNLQATKTVAVPAGWDQAWQDAHVREGEDVVLAWGELAGADPTRAPAALRFDPARAVDQLDALYALDVHDLAVVDEDGAIARHKIVVVVDGTWSQGPGAPASDVLVPQSGGLARTARGATGTVVGGVGLVRVDVPSLTARGHESATAPATAGPALVGGSEFDPSWELARGFAEVVQAFAVLDTPGGFGSNDAATFWAASAAYLATVAAPGGIGSPADLVRSSQLHWGSPRLGDGSWLLLQYLAERDGDQLLGTMWREAEAGEDPLTTYKRLTGISQADLNRRVAEYALRTVAWDFMDRSAIAAAVDRLDPALLADRTTPVEPVEGDPGHYRVLDAFAPSDYGFTVVRLTPEPGARTIHVRVRGHGSAADAGLSFGFVAIRAGEPRYSPVTESLDEQVQLTLRAGEHEAYLVVTATPTVNHQHSASDGFGEVARYPYEFRVSGATVSGGIPDPAALGGHLHANGGGFVDDSATVDPTAYVGPEAVVRGDAKVLDHARIEGRAWVEAGAVVEGGAVVRDVAIVRSGAHLSGSAIVGGDAVVSFTCGEGSYTSFDPARWCDHRDAPADVNPVPAPFTAADLLLTNVPQPSPTPEPSTPTESPTPTPTPKPTPTPRSTPSTTPKPQPNVPAQAPTAADVEPPEPIPATACSAVYRITNHWTSDGQNWFQAEVVVTAGSSGVEGWAVSWPLPQGVQITSQWNARLGTSGSTATAENMSYNGSLRDGATATFGFHGTGPGDAGLAVPQTTCTRTR